MGSNNPPGNIFIRSRGHPYLLAREGMPVTEQPKTPMNRSRTSRSQSLESAQAKMFERTGPEQLSALTSGIIPPPLINNHVGLESFSGTAR